MFRRLFLPLAVFVFAASAMAEVKYPFDSNGKKTAAYHQDKWKILGHENLKKGEEGRMVNWNCKLDEIVDKENMIVYCLGSGTLVGLGGERFLATSGGDFVVGQKNSASGKLWIKGVATEQAKSVAMSNSRREFGIPMFDDTLKFSNIASGKVVGQKEIKNTDGTVSQIPLIEVTITKVPRKAKPAKTSFDGPNKAR